MRIIMCLKKSIHTIIRIIMIDKTSILRNYHEHAIVIVRSNVQDALAGMIVDDSPEDHCVVVKNPDLVEYYETRKESLLERVYFSDIKAIEYQ